MPKNAFRAGYPTWSIIPFSKLAFRCRIMNVSCLLSFFSFADCGGEMAGQEYKRHLLNTLCSSRYVRKEAEILFTVKLIANG